MNTVQTNKNEWFTTQRKLSVNLFAKIKIADI